MKILLLVLAWLFVAATGLSMVSTTSWWVRVLDFPRAQIAAGGVGLAAVFSFHWDVDVPFEVATFAALAAAVTYQCIRILPYTFLWPRQSANAVDPEAARVRLMIANVQMENRQADRFLELVEKHDPDVLFAVEIDDWWDARLRRLQAEYPHVVRRPQDNHYGVVLSSKTAIRDPEFHFLTDDSVPSVRARIEIPGGVAFDFWGLHPRPPHLNQDSDQRDAELLCAAHAVRDRDSRVPAVIGGDLNDVAWSRTTRRFQEVSRLLDPRVGRGLYSTFHAGNPLLRFPLDHIFHSRGLRLVALQRLAGFGSDHFPILVELAFEPEAGHG